MKPLFEYINEASKPWSKVELEACERLLHKLLEENDWYDGHQLKSNKQLSIRNINTKVLRDKVELTYTIMHRVNGRRIENQATVYFNPDTVHSIDKYIDEIESMTSLNESMSGWKETSGCITKTVKNGSVIINKKGVKCRLTLRYNGYTGGVEDVIDDISKDEAIKQGEEFLKNPKKYFDEQ